MIVRFSQQVTKRGITLEYRMHPTVLGLGLGLELGLELGIMVRD